MPPYTHFRMIGYQVPTAAPGSDGPPARPVIAGWGAGTEPDPVTDIPVDATLDEDPRIRLKRLATAVNAAYTALQRPGMADNANTLKVFITPEFYMRPPASLGADYKGNTYPVKVGTKILRSLNEMFVNAKFANWLFVCGTVMWNTHAQKGPVPLYFNTAVLVQGGQADSLYVVEKQSPSSIDGVPIVTFSDGIKSWRNYGGPGKDPTVGPFLQSWKMRKQHVLNFGGVTVGVEVCLDHLDSPTCRVLKRVIEDWYWNQQHVQHPGVQLHILTAGGMPIKASSLATKVGGYILRSDGMAVDSPRVQMQRVTGYTSAAWDTGVGIGPSDDDAVATLVDITPVWVRIPAVKGALVPDPPAPYPAPPRPQRLAFFPTTPLP